MPAQAWSRIPRALALVLSAAVATLSAGLLGTPSQAAAAFSCTGNPNHPVSTSKALGISGLYTVPEQTPTGLAVFGHGYRNNSLAWAGKAPTSPSGPGHLEEAAQKGLIAVAPDYSGLGPAPDYRGWPAAAGAGDLVKAAQFLVSACPSINQVVLLGVSMGGNMTGLAMAADAKRPGSHRPLFDYWIDVEGVTNWIETYAEATAAGRGGNAYAAGAQQDIEKECGGPLGPTTAPCYQNRDVAARSVDVANSGVKGVAMVHAVLDGLVPSDQSREMSTALRGLGIPTDQFNVMRRNTNEGQTTLLTDASQSQLDATLQPAGHGWEGSNTDIVIMTGLNLMFTYFQCHSTTPANREVVVDAYAGSYPSAMQCPAAVGASSAVGGATSGSTVRATGSLRSRAAGSVASAAATARARASARDIAFIPN